jgi:mRNA interferase MazF
VCVVTRDAAIGVLHGVTCAPITKTVRGIASEVEVGAESGLPDHGVISCDNLMTILKESLDSEPVGALDLERRILLDQALRYALDIAY